MVSRVGARPVWLLALLAWPPLLLTGLWLLTGAQLDRTDVGRAEWTMSLFVPAPEGWFEEPVRATAGAVMAVAGLVAYILFRREPDPRDWRGVVSLFSPLLVAGLVFAAMAAMARWDLSGHVVETASSGLHWRFIASTRHAPPNVVTALASLAASLTCLGLSVAPAWHVWPRDATPVAATSGQSAVP